MKTKKVIVLVLISLFVFVSITLSASAQQTTVLPQANQWQDCDDKIDRFLAGSEDMKSSDTERAVLGCGVQTGRISLSMVPYFIKYFSNYLLGLVGLIAVIFVMIGGYFYAVGSLIEKKEVGKTYIKNALMGMAVAFLAWSVVNVILAAITG